MTGDATGVDGGRQGEILCALVEEMRELYGQLDALSQRQCEIIDRENHEPLLTLLEERQQLIDRLIGLKRRVDPVRKRWEAEGGGSDGSPVTESLRGIARIVAAIGERDAMAASALEEHRRLLQRELAELGRGRAAFGMYGGGDQAAGPRFQDVEG